VKHVPIIIDQLEQTPVVLGALLGQIPRSRYTEKRLPDKWTIHEQVCHLVSAQDILIERFRKFEREEKPHISSHDPARDQAEDFYLRMDFEESLARFPMVRKRMVGMLRAFPQSYWSRTGTHDAFDPYNTQLLLNHCISADYSHIFSIEQLGLTRDEHRSEIMVLP
jgi:hypothetical protein